MATIIDRLYEENLSLLEYLNNVGEVSLAAVVSESFRKALALSAASYFETLIQDSIVSVVRECSGGTDAVLEFVKNKAIERQYHTYFDWDRSNANKFFGLFGSSFKEYMTKRTQASADLAASIKAFVELGSIRNQLVHGNFAVFALDKTAEDIYGLFSSALMFVNGFPQDLRNYCTQMGVIPEDAADA
jgi:hypothetical protein